MHVETIDDSTTLPAVMEDDLPKAEPADEGKIDGRRTNNLSMMFMRNPSSKRWSIISNDIDGDDGDSRKCGNSLDAQRLFILEAKQAASCEFRLSTYSTSLRSLMTDGSMDDVWNSMRSVVQVDDSPKRNEAVKEKPVKKSNNNNNKKFVRFSIVQIREHPIIVGQNPGGTQGPPITIAWTALQEYSLPIDLYEEARVDTRRPFENLRMTRTHRDMLLKELGFSLQERREGTRIANIIRRQRQQSIANAHRDEYHEKLEKVARALKNAALLGRKKAKERRLLDQSFHSSNSSSMNLENSYTSILSNRSDAHLSNSLRLNISEQLRV